MNKLVLLLIGTVFALCNVEGETAAVVPQERIIGGSLVPAMSSASYMVSVQLWNNRNTVTRGHKCGGALISTRHVVTTAACVVTIQGSLWIADNPNLYRVFSGQLNLAQADTSANTRRITQIFPHQLFQPITFLNDVAVLVLNSAFALSSSRQLIRIRTQIPLDNVMCQHTGWGGEANGLISMQMRMLSTLTYSNLQCGATYNNSGITSLVGWGNLCSSNVAGHAPCLYDVGGPLVCSNELFGVLSWAAHCNALPGAPSVFTRIDVYANWINQILATSDASTVHIASFLLPFLAFYHLLQNVKLY